MFPTETIVTSFAINNNNLRKNADEKTFRNPPNNFSSGATLIAALIVTTATIFMFMVTMKMLFHFGGYIHKQSTKREITK